MQKLSPIHISAACKVPIPTRKLGSQSDSDTSTSLMSLRLMRDVEFSGPLHLFVAQADHPTYLPQGGKIDQ